MAGGEGAAACRPPAGTAGEPLPTQDMREAILACRREDMPIFDYPGPPAPADART